jgi:hypothetical protein
MHKMLWASKVTGILISRILGLLTWESQDKMTFGCRPRHQVQKNYKGEGGGFPQVRAVVNFVSPHSPHDLCVHQKCFNYALTNSLFDLCKPVWIIDSRVTLLSPHLEILIRPSTPEVLGTKEHTLITYPSVVFTFGLTVKSIKEFGGVSIYVGGFIHMKKNESDFVWMNVKNGNSYDFMHVKMIEFVYVCGGENVIFSTCVF